MSNSAKDRRALIKNDQVEQLKRMVEIREFEEICFNLFAEGLIRGTTHLCNGQEAVAVGIASSLEVTDYVMCTYRGHGHALALGMTPETVLSEIMGNDNLSISKQIQRYQTLNLAFMAPETTSATTPAPAIIKPTSLKKRLSIRLRLSGLPL